jgi:YbgC/YbaW family acyl-CoA thioester hydrolase
VRITDINYGNHLGNDAILSILHEARLQYLHQLGYTELNTAGVSLIMGDVVIVFKGEGFYGDVLRISMQINELTSAGFSIYYQIENQNQKKIAEAKTGMVCFDYTTRKIAKIPAELSNKYQ